MAGIQHNDKHKTLFWILHDCYLSWCRALSWDLIGHFENGGWSRKRVRNHQLPTKCGKISREFAVSIVPADGLEPSDARSSADTMMTKFGCHIHIHMEPTLEGLLSDWAAGKITIIVKVKYLFVFVSLFNCRCVPQKCNCLIVLMMCYWHNGGTCHQWIVCSTFILFDSHRQTFYNGINLVLEIGHLSVEKR